MNWVLEPLHYTFMQRSLLAVVLIGVTCTTLGVYKMPSGAAIVLTCTV